MSKIKGYDYYGLNVIIQPLRKTDLPSQSNLVKLGKSGEGYAVRNYRFANYIISFGKGQILEISKE